jgi:hypothetical protein
LTPSEILRAALEGRPATRPLFGPVVSELAADIEAIDRARFVLDPGKMAKLLAELQRGSSLDVVWTATSRNRLAGPVLDAALEATRRLRQTIGERAVVGAAIPASHLEPVRSLLEAGVQLILLEDIDEVANLGTVRPVVAAIRFRRALAAVRIREVKADDLRVAGDPLPVVPMGTTPGSGLLGVSQSYDELDGRLAPPAGTVLLTTRAPVDGEISLSRLSSWRS